MNTKPTLIQYQDYRQFLSDKFHYLKSKNKKTSFQYLANKANLSKTYLRNILDKKRHLSLDKVFQTAKAFQCDSTETEYFFFLVILNTSKDSQIKKFLNYGLNVKKAELYFNKKNPELYSKNLSVSTETLPSVIHALARFKDFKAHPLWIHKKLSNKDIPLDEIEKTLATLIENGSLVKNNKKWEPKEFIFTKAQGLLQSEFEVYKSSLDSFWEATETPQKYKPGTFHMLSLSFDAASTLKAIEGILELRNKLINLSKLTQNPVEVFHIFLGGITLASDLPS